LLPGPDSPAGIQPEPASPRTDTLLGQGWRFLPADAAGAEQPGFDDTPLPWQSVTVPHTWNALDGQDGGANYRRGVGWYRLHFAGPAAASGRRTYLQFDAANSVSAVYLNGQRLGQHRGGFAAFRYDASAALRPGDNVLAVEVDNSAVADVPPLSADFTFFGGLYRDVHLISVSDLHVDLDDAGSPGVYLETSDVSAQGAQLRARVRVSNAAAGAAVAHVTLAVADAAGTVVASYAADLPLAAGETSEVALGGRIDTPHLWNGRADPYLYRATARVEEGAALVDAVAQPLGFRSFAVDPNSGFSLNGQPLDLHGVNRHQDRVNLGWAIGKAEHDQDMALLLELGATAVRLAHYQHSQYFYELCDRAGVVVWAEIPLVDAITDSQPFRDNARQQLRELIRQSYNHPSILFWGIGNEQRTDDAASNALLEDLAALVRTEDPARLSTYAHCCASDTGGLPQHADLSAYNEYFGWYTGTYDQFGAWADALHAARPAARLALSEYGAGAALSQHQDPPQQPTPGGLFHPEEYQAVFHEAHWAALRTRPYLWGKFIWNLFDFASDGRNEGDSPGRNDKGLISYDRKTKKDAFFWYKANWSSEPFVYITGRRFEPRTTASIDIKVYSNLPRVSLRVNGVDASELGANDHIFRWPGSALRQGANQVEVTGKSADGSSVASDSVTWTRQ
jgi:beta-galactosidase